MRQHFLLGAELRKRYVDSSESKLLDSQYNKDQVLVKSSHYERTVQSAMSQMYGLFPLGTGLSLENSDSMPLPPFNTEMRGLFFDYIKDDALPDMFYPVPVFTEPLGKDYLFHGHTTCAKSVEISESFARSRERSYYLRQNFDKKVRNNLARALNKSARNTTFEIATDVVDVLLSDRFHGFANSFNLQPEVIEKLEKLYDWHLITEKFPNQEIVRLCSSQILREILHNFQRIASKQNGYKFILYSGHDSTLICFLKSLKFHDISNHTDFASQIIIELHSHETANNVFFLRFYLNDKLIKIKNCNENCDLTKFTEIVESSTYPNVAEICEKSDMKLWQKFLGCFLLGGVTVIFGYLIVSSIQENRRVRQTKKQEEELTQIRL